MYLYQYSIVGHCGRKFLDFEEIFKLLIRITALVCCFVSNCKHSISKHPERRLVGFITLNELQLTECFWLLKSQSTAFHDELVCLKANKNVHRKSALTSLSPFIDDQVLIRVGGSSYKCAYAL
jgi:hypothetical protein